MPKSLQKVWATPTHMCYIPMAIIFPSKDPLGPAMEPLQLSTNLASCYNTALEPEEYKLQFCVCHLSKWHTLSTSIHWD